MTATHATGATLPAPQRVVVVGGGNVARALGGNLHRLGHEVRYADLTILAIPFDVVVDVVGLLEEAARYWGLLAFRGGLGRGVVLVAHHRGGAAPTQ